MAKDDLNQGNADLRLLVTTAIEEDTLQETARAGRYSLHSPINVDADPDQETDIKRDQGLLAEIEEEAQDGIHDLHDLRGTETTPETTDAGEAKIEMIEDLRDETQGINHLIRAINAETNDSDQELPIENKDR